MIKIKNNAFTEEVLAAIIRLATAPLDKFDVPTTFTLGKLKKVYLEAYKEYMELRNKYVKKYCTKDEDGKPIMVKFQGKDSYKFEGEDGKIFQEKMIQLSNVTFDLDVRFLEFGLSTFPRGVLNGNDFHALNDSGIMHFEDDEIKDQKG